MGELGLPTDMCLDRGSYAILLFSHQKINKSESGSAIVNLNDILSWIKISINTDSNLSVLNSYNVKKNSISL